MPGLNRCCFIGFVGGDPETRQVGDARVANFNIGVTERTKDGDKTEWVRCCAWGKLAELAERLLRRGRLVYVEGKMQTKGWEDKSGQKRYTTQIVVVAFEVLDRKDGGTGDAQRAERTQRRQDWDDVERNEYGRSPAPEPNTDDYLPF